MKANRHILQGDDIDRDCMADEIVVEQCLLEGVEPFVQEHEWTLHRLVEDHDFVLWIQAASVEQVSDLYHHSLDVHQRLEYPRHRDLRPICRSDQMGWKNLQEFTVTLDRDLPRSREIDGHVGGDDLEGERHPLQIVPPGQLTSGADMFQTRPEFGQWTWKNH